MKIYTLFILLIIALVSRNNAIAQTASISGKVTDAGKPLVAASVSLLNGRDSSWIRSVLTDDNGEYKFTGLSGGNYLIAATSVGYEGLTQLLAAEGSKENITNVVLQKQSTALKEVAVTAKKPFVEMSLGKTIVNIEGTSTTAGTNVLDLMRRLPGISVDMNGNISMQGKQGVLVLIDDRPTYLSGDDLAAYLKAITADDAAQIELITQPGAKYDASGNSGVINIKLKKNKKAGWNGNITLSYGQAVYFHRDESFLLNYKKNKWTLSLSGSDMEAMGFADWKENRYYLDEQTGKATAVSIIHSTPKERFSNTALRLTADYDLTDKTTIGINARSTYHPNTNHRGYIYTANTDLVNNLSTTNIIIPGDDFIRKDVSTNAYLTHKFSKENRLDINFDYLNYSKSTHQDLVNTLYDGQMQPQADPLITRTHQPESIKVYSLKADQTYTLKNEIKLEAGLKSSWETTDFIQDVSVYKNNEWQNDPGMTNHFLYKENINAGYASLSKKLWKKWEAHAGLRAEQTNIEGLQYVGSTSFSRNYISVFPTVYLTYKKDTNNQFELNYGRRIDRPGYSELNPFVYYSFENYYSVGNPYLRPQFTNSIELKHSYKSMIITTLSFFRVNDIMNDVYQIDSATRNVYNVTENLSSYNCAMLSVTFNKDLLKWWTVNASGTAFYGRYSGTISGNLLHAELSGYSLHLNTQFDFGSGWKSEAYINYTSGGRISLTTSFDQNVYTELGGSKKINDHFVVKADFSDPFNLYHLGIHTNMDNYRSDSKFRYASQLFSFSLTYNFGGKQTAERAVSTIDEASRIR